MSSRLATWKQRGPLLVALAASIYFGASFGYTYGVDNQVVYMLGALRLLDPTILNHDWFATQTTHYHPAFNFVAAALIAVDRRGVAVCAAQNAVIAAGMVSVYWLLQRIAGRRAALPSFLLLLAAAFISRTRAPGATYIFDPILQPSGMAGMAFLASLPFFVEGRWLASGALVALSGLFHANYLILLLMAFGVAHLLLGKQGLFPRLCLHLALPSLVLLLFLPMILSTAGSPRAAEAQAIYFNIRAPHHFVPSSYEREFIPFAAWHMIGVGAALHRLRQDSRGRRLGAVIAGLSLVIWTGLCLSTFVHVQKVTQLFSWRLVPHCTLLLQAIACAGVASVLIEPASTRKVTIGDVGLVIAGIALLCMYSGNHNQPAMPNLVLAVTAGVIVWKAVSAAANAIPRDGVREKLARFWSRGGPGFVTACTLVPLAAAAATPMSTIRQRMTVINRVGGGEAALYAWMRESSPKNAVFLTPPIVETMRFHGQRAIVVDWKSNPIVPGEVLEWYDRLKHVTGRPGFAGWRDLEGYSSMDKARLVSLRERYHVDFAVVRRGQEGALQGFPVAYSNASYAVLDVRKKD